VLLLEFGDQEHLARFLYIFGVLDADADGHGAAAGVAGCYRGRSARPEGKAGQGEGAG
jgi:hypothetical protein